ncbi:transmembrane protein 130-like [Tetranychus urticae]|uniref:transmembrane protein 130-like n=1 Tax=Tetranychus urticae TaxID=32264 RepID=UPI000D656016|nr:transmembrane protein 130-like [Tetranychus urticae]
MKILSSFLLLCIVSFNNGISYVECAYSPNRAIFLHNSGPQSISDPIGFTVTVFNSSKSNDTSYEYRFKFDQFPEHDKTIVSTSIQVRYSVTFASTCVKKSGEFTLQVDVWECHLGVPTYLIGTAPETFYLYACDWIEVHNDGPVTLDAPITFTVNNKYRTDDPSFEYRFKFDQFPQHDKTIVSIEREVEYSVTFESSSTPKPGNYTVQVDLWFLGVPSRLIATALHDFQLSDELVGFINRENFIEDSILGKNFISTEIPVELIAEIRDPTGFFTGRCGIPPANITYKWIINDEVQEERSKVIVHTFSQPRLNNISVFVTATKTNGSRLIQKSGSFNTTLESRAPITNLTVDGPTEVKVFERLQLDFKIHGGTPPFHITYHFSMKNPHTETERIVKGTNESLFSLINYFSDEGTRDLYLVLENDVSSYSKSMAISVH